MRINHQTLVCAVAAVASAVGCLAAPIAASSDVALNITEATTPPLNSAPINQPHDEAALEIRVGPEMAEDLPFEEDAEILPEKEDQNDLEPKSKQLEGRGSITRHHPSQSRFRKVTDKPKPLADGQQGYGPVKKYKYGSREFWRRGVIRTALSGPHNKKWAARKKKHEEIEEEWRKLDRIQNEKHFDDQGYLIPNTKNLTAHFDRDKYGNAIKKSPEDLSKSKND